MSTLHFPALLIILPMMAAPLCVMIRHAYFAWLTAVVTNIVVIFMAVVVWSQLGDEDAIRYSLGGWAAPTGIEYYIDRLNSTLLFVIALISLFALMYAPKTLDTEIISQRHYLFYAGWLTCLTGLLGIVITGDAFNVFVFLEISSLSMYMLIALGQDRKRALLAAFRYLIMGSIGASFILIGIGFLYAATGTLNMLDLSQRIPAVQDSRTIVVAFSFITLGLLIKAAVFPLHAWLPNAYQFAPSAAGAFLAGTATKVSLYILLRFFFHIFGGDYSFGQMLLSYVLLPLSVISFITMSLVAIFQTDIRRMLAYSSVAQIGYIVAGFSMASLSGLTAAVVHIINHAFIKAALFIAVGCIIYRLGSAQIKNMGGLIKNMPWTCSAFIVAGLSLIGVPLTAGFVSKWTIVSAALDNNWWPLVVLILFSSLMAIVYIGKVIEVICFKGSDDESAHAQIKEAPLSMLIPLWALVIISVYFGLHGEVVVDTASIAAQQLLEGMKP